MTKKRRQIDTAAYIDGILKGDRTLLGRAISLAESNAPAHQQQAQAVLQQLMPYTGNSVRIGITGVPGAGKSTLIETFGLYLIEQGYRVAVLAVDPSSSITKGSILGDKTRMENLARHPDSFIRPSPSGGTLGGVTRKTRETILVCEAAGYNIILVETIGVGQSEVAVRAMVDFFLLLQIAGGGDELQGIKKGVMELADAIVVNKADGDNEIQANAAKKDYSMALRYLPPATEGWKTRAYTCSALTGKGIPEIWDTIQKFQENTTASEVFSRRRQQQAKAWMYDLIKEKLQQLFFQNPQIKPLLHEIATDVLEGKIPATAAAQKLLKKFEEGLGKL